MDDMPVLTSGVPIRHSDWLKARNAQIVADYNSGLSMDAVAEKYDLTRQRIEQVLLAAGHFERHWGREMPRSVIAREQSQARAEARAAKRAARDQVRAKIFTLYDQGATYLEMARNVGCSVGQVENVLRDAGKMNRRPDNIGVPRGKLTPEQKREIANRYASGENVTAIAADFGIVPNYVAHVARNLGARRPGVRVNSRAA